MYTTYDPVTNLVELRDEMQTENVEVQTKEQTLDLSQSRFLSAVCRKLASCDFRILPRKLSLNSSRNLSPRGARGGERRGQSRSRDDPGTMRNTKCDTWSRKKREVRIPWYAISKRVRTLFAC